MVSEIVNDAREQISFRQIEQGVEHINTTVIKLKKLVRIFLSNFTPRIEEIKTLKMSLSLVFYKEYFS